MNPVVVYQKLAEHILPYLYGRPVMVVGADGGHRMWARQQGDGLLRESEQTGVPLQVWSLQEFLDLLTVETPAELHVRARGFWEHSRSLIVYDLDTAPHSGIQTSFRWGKRFREYLRQRPEVSSSRMLFTGNRGFHIRVCLNRRYEPEPYQQLLTTLLKDFGEPFLGDVDTKPSLPQHFVRCPHSFNIKGQRFSYFVDNCDDFNTAAADEMNARILRYCGLL